MTTASALIRFIHLASSALLLGSLGFYFLVSRPALRSVGGEGSPEFAAFNRRLLRLAQWTLLIIFLSGLLAFWLQIVSVADLLATVCRGLGIQFQDACRGVEVSPGGQVTP